MKLKFLELSQDERRLYFNQAAIRRNLDPVIMEKDFWVSWLLAILFNSEFGPSLVFKGGTSLSKVFGIIDRFSEDIDLSFSPAFLTLPRVGSSRNQANKWTKLAESACGIAFETRIQSYLEGIVGSILEKHTRPWFQFLIDPATRSPILLFRYPSTQPDGFEYLNRSVKLEFGSLTDQQPSGTHEIRPWLGEVLPDAFEDWQCKVVALEIERTFWEKATILHSEYHRPSGKSIPDRYSRHYADMASLAKHSCASSSVVQTALRNRVIEWKKQFFSSAWSNYDLAKQGGLRLVPPPERQADLSRDYLAMRDMYLTEPESFESILSTLADLEAKINQYERL
ncbi:MAG: nucleotidyl transferase AbiEii/AbiGii toxin family protein [Planctomycetota bacterium]|nr:nucleotidyl transferase AbiEii/AbiGii toxin family protein [Planctomycetota bacterium]